MTNWTLVKEQITAECRHHFQNIQNDNNTLTIESKWSGTRKILFTLTVLEKRCFCENDCEYSFDACYIQNIFYIKSNSAPKFQVHISTCTFICKDSTDLLFISHKAVHLKMFSQLFLLHFDLEMQHKQLWYCNMQDSKTTVTIALTFKLCHFPPPFFSSNSS